MHYCDEAGILHVLNDWDLATLKPSSGTANMERIGKIPFMASDLLLHDQVIHMFRHDVESFMWVSVKIRCTCRPRLVSEITRNVIDSLYKEKQ